MIVYCEGHFPKQRGGLDLERVDMDSRPDIAVGPGDVAIIVVGHQSRQS